jgi:hypothetical protein
MHNSRPGAKREAYKSTTSLFVLSGSVELFMSQKKSDASGETDESGGRLLMRNEVSVTMKK